MMGGGRKDEVPVPQATPSLKMVTRQQSASSLTKKSESPNSSTPSKTGSSSATTGKSVRQRRKRKKVSPEEERAFETAYLKEFMMSVMVDEVAREQTRILEAHMRHTLLLPQLEGKMESFLASDNDPGCMKELETLLVAAAGVGDAGVNASSNMLELVEDKLYRVNRAKDRLDELQEGRGHKAIEKATMMPTMLSIINNSYYSGGSKQPNGTPSKENSQEANGTDVAMKRAGAGQASLSPDPASSSSSLSKPNAGAFYFPEPPEVDDSGYRACKFRNPPNYSGMCGKLLPVNRKKRQTSNAGRNGDGTKRLGDDDSGSSSSEDNKGDESPAPIYCLCESVSHGKMIECDNGLCPWEWFHFKCVGLTKAPKTRWYCPKCRGDTSCVKKSRDLLMKDLMRYNKRKEKELA